MRFAETPRKGSGFRVQDFQTTPIRNLGTLALRSFWKLRLAYVAFNAPDWAEFVIEGPTPVRDGKKEVAKVYHYLDQLATPARNVVLAQDTD